MREGKGSEFGEAIFAFLADEAVAERKKIFKGAAENAGVLRLFHHDALARKRDAKRVFRTQIQSVPDIFRYGNAPELIDAADMSRLFFRHPFSLLSDPLPQFYQ